jgi:hypothetical protein
MSITKTLLASTAGAVLASGMAAAGEPMKLSATEMDQVTAGVFQAGAFAFPTNLQGVSGSFSDTLFAGGRETTTINSLTNFSSFVSANAGGTSTGTGTGGIVNLGEPVLVEGLFIFGGLEAFSAVATNVVF